MQGELLERDDLTRGEELCRALGFEPVLAPNAGSRYGYLAGSDQQRLGGMVRPDFSAASLHLRTLVRAQPRPAAKETSSAPTSAPCSPIYENPGVLNRTRTS